MNSSLDIFANKAKSLPLLTSDQERELAISAQNGDSKAVDKLVSHNLRFVLQQAHKYKKYCNSTHIEFEDIVQAGNMGLVKAAQRFDPNKGFKFTSYSVYWIRAFIVEYIFKFWNKMKIYTTKDRKKLFWCQGAFNDMKYMTGNQVADAEQKLAKDKGVKISEVKNMKNHFDSRYVELHDFMVSLNPNQEDAAIKEQELSLLRDSFTILNEKETDIIYKFFFEEKNLKQIGEEYGISGEAVRQRKVRIIEKLKLNIEKNKSAA